MRAGALTVAGIVVMAVAVLFVSVSGHRTAERHVEKLKVATQLREQMLTQELALNQALNGLGAERLSTVTQARRELDAALRRAHSLAEGNSDERQIIDAHRAALSLYHRHSADDLLAARAERRDPVAAKDERLEPLSDYLATSDRYIDRLEAERRADARRAAVVPGVVIVVLSALFGVVAVLMARRARRARAEHEAAATEHRRGEEDFQTGQRRLAEALQVAASQSEAHELVKRHLESVVDGSAVHILNRNNSADRLESSTPLPAESPLCEPLRQSEPRSCIAVRLSREFERGPGAREVLECSVCGRLEGESVCRPLLVGGEVIGSVLVESGETLDTTDRRRVEESVTAAAPVLANLRNLAIAEVRAATDALTGLPNRRSLDDTIKRMVAQAGRTLSPLTVLQCDLDHFKQINDTFGHDRGDAVLAGFGALLRSQLRASDFAARAGGEEFVILLPDTDRVGGLQLAEKLRHACGSMQVDGIERRITVSIGMAVYPDDGVDDTSLLRLADRALYTAKRGGRDRVEVAGAAEVPDPVG